MMPDRLRYLYFSTKVIFEQSAQLGCIHQSYALSTWSDYCLYLWSKSLQAAAYPLMFVGSCCIRYL